MEYTSPQPISRGLASLCPHASLLATANGNLLSLHSLHDNAIIRTITTAGPVTHLCWTPTEPTLLAAASPGGNIVIVDSAGDVISDLYGSRLETAWLTFGKHGRLLLGYEHGLGTAVFDVVAGRRLAFIPHARRAIVSRCGRFAALVVRAGVSPDALAILALATARVQHTIHAPAGISRLAGVGWRREALAVWGWADSARGHPVLATVSPRGVILSGGPVSSAVRMCAAHDGSGVWAVGHANGELVLMDGIRGKVALVAKHDAPQARPDAPPVVFRERRKKISDHESEGIHANGENVSHAANAARKRLEKVERAEFEVVPFGPNVDVGQGFRADGGRAGRPGADGRTRHGVAWTGMSGDGRYAASRGEAAPHVLLIWDIPAARLAAVLVLRDEVVCARWSGEARLAIVCGGAHVYIWESRGAAAVRVGGEFGWRKPFCARRIEWGAGDRELVVVDGMSANAFLTVFL